MTRKISVRAIVVHEGKLLCVRLKPYGYSADVSPDEWWCTPGGTIEDGEPLLDAMRREMIEETGIEPVIGDLLYVQQFSHGDKDIMDFFFHVTNAEDYLVIDLSKTSHGGEEIAEIGFIDPKSKIILPEFLSQEDLAAKVSSTSAVQIFNRY
jgi:8-oxo-dGTP pyrophosphatase MutT (NUDIX family)